MGRGIPTHVRVAKVESINTTNHTAVVSLMSDEGSVIPDVQILSAYSHVDDGCGNRVLPEVGAMCMIAYANDRYPPVILGYLAPLAPGEGFTGGLPELAAGDQVIAGGEQGFIILRRCGVLELGATPLSSLTFIPVDNLIRAVFGNLEVVGGLGSIKWTGDEEGGHLRVGVASASGGVDEVIIRAGDIEFGAHSGPDNVLGPADMRLELLVSPDGGETIVAGLHLSAEGNTSFESAGNVGYMVVGNWEINVDDYLKIVSKKTIRIESSDNTEVDATGKLTAASQRQIHMSVAGADVFKGNPGGIVELAGGGTPVAMAGGVIAVAEAIAGAITSINPAMGAAVEAAVAGVLSGVAATKVTAQ